MGPVLIALATTVCFFCRKGLLNWFIWIVMYCYLRITRRVYGRRLDLYDISADGQPEKMGFFIPHEEWTLESPQDADKIEKSNDLVFCMGRNSNSETLALSIARLGNGKVHFSLALQMANGCTYTLPPEHSIQTEIDEPHTFGSSRCKMQCLLPMRKWRIFFNGILRENSHSQEDGTIKYRHVKFTFIWTASSDVFDYMYDMSLKLQAKAAAEFCSWKCPPIHTIRRLKNLLDFYEQCGMLLGTVTLEGEPEKEVYLWGNRARCLNRKSELQEFQELDVFASFENGTFIRIGVINIPGFIREYTYGYVMRPSGFIFPIESCTFLKRKEGPNNETHFVCEIDGGKYTVKLVEDGLQSEFQGGFNGKLVNGTTNSMAGRGLILENKVEKQVKPDDKPQKYDSVQCAGLLPKYIPASIPFYDPCCQVLSVSGGKGSSLAKLTLINEELKTFTVPKGIVVSTSAYNSFTQGFLDVPLKKLEGIAWKQNQDKTAVSSACESVMREITKAELPKSVAESIERSLHEVFGNEISNLRLAVRSSATGEDTEQMSAAGQMDTFLGCKGISEVLNAVKKCWASQFSFVAVEYKRRYGQPLNTPMAVVIQEMVPCDVAGVTFTCDPVTGNPSFVSITANYGLGESVVSASAEPDTLTLKRDINNKLHFHSKAAGIKQSKIIMDEFGGTKEVKLDQEKSSEYSISEDTALEIGDLAVKIEMKFGAPRDIEWGVLNGEIFLFQARPVTTIDTETDFEMMHMFDTQMRREDELSSTANVGEVLPGSLSPLGLYFMKDLSEVSFGRHKYVKWNGVNLPVGPYYAKGIVYAYNHVLFSLSDAFFKFDEGHGGEISNHTKAITVAIFGRVIDDKNIFEVAKDRHADSKKSGTSIKSIIYIILYMFFAEYFTKGVSKKIDKFRVPIEKNSCASEILRSISKHYHEIYIAMNNHMDCTFTSPFWNLSLLNLLSKARGVWDNDVYRDFGYLLSSLKQVESADVPSAIQSLGFTISRCIDPEEFKKMNVEEALEWLQTTPSEAGKKFRNFLTRHGHRCSKEFDVYSKTWAMDPRTLIRTLQGVIIKGIEDPTEKETNSFQTITSNMHVKLTAFQRLQLRLLLPHCQRGVRERELSKSLVIKAMDKMRTAFYQLADAMVREGRLPNQDLLFFLCAEEVHQLIKTRSPTLVTRAFRRWKCHPEMDKLIFPEMISGIPKPVNMNEDLDISGDGFSMTGVPVSQGVVKGIARVVVNIEDAPNIQYGDILITYSTDIAWSPYFPMLSGVVTELGGLISHGAVVAREYGLPCVVNLHGATRAFKSGDLVLLDGNRGVLQKIDNL